MKLFLYELGQYKYALEKDEEENTLFFDEEIDGEGSQEGNIYIGTIERIDNASEAVFVRYDSSAKLGFLRLKSIHPSYFHLSNEKTKISSFKGNSLKKSEFYTTISSKGLKIGQPIIVQVIRDSSEKKGAMLSSFIVFESENLKYIPNSINQRITGLHNIELIDFIENKDIKGSIVAKNPLTKEKFLKELNYFHNLWKEITKTKRLGVVYSNNSLFDRLIRRNLSNKIFVPNSRVFEKVKEISRYLTDRELSINIDYYSFLKIEEEIRESFYSKNKLPSGGHVFFNKTEAGVFIDVNIGSFRREEYKEAIRKTNMEAARKIFDQLIKRNIGGLIVVDFIDMEGESKKDLEEEIKNLRKKDKRKISSTPSSEFGLVQICRQYKGKDIYQRNFILCSCCLNGLKESFNSKVNRFLRSIDLSIDVEALSIEDYKFLIEKKMEEFTIALRGRSLQVTFDMAQKNVYLSF